MNKQTLKTLAVALALAVAVQAIPAQAAASVNACKYLRNTACDAPRSLLDEILSLFSFS